MSDELSPAQFVSLFREVAPYVNLFRGKTFVVAFGGKAISGPLARTLAYDANLLVAHTMGRARSGRRHGRLGGRCAARGVGCGVLANP